MLGHPLVLAHQELAGAPDEVAAVPKLMAELGITGVLFTADALHCQKDGFAQAASTGNGFNSSQKTVPWALSNRVLQWPKAAFEP